VIPLHVAGTGLYLPATVETAEDLAPRVGKDAAWIREVAGVAERRIADLPVAEMAARAARAALGEGPPPDAVVNASLTPAQLVPDTGVFVAQALGLSGVPAFSVHATCLSFLVGAQVAAGLLHTGAARRVLVVSSEIATIGRDFAEPESAVLLGDGAGAAVFERPPPGATGALLGFRMATYPDGAGLAEITGFGTRFHPDAPGTGPQHHRFHMRGGRLYRWTLPRVGALLDALFQEVGLRPDDVQLVVPHQASGPALAALGGLGFPPGKVVDILGRAGNCIAASIPMALATAAAEGRLRRGDTVLLLGTGAGVSIAAALLRW
jgi:3-oxoacyl-[acyl-carrier-protein] synthase-3